jgi:hypothetical protein
MFAVHRSWVIASLLACAPFVGGCTGSSLRCGGGTVEQSGVCIPAPGDATIQDASADATFIETACGALTPIAQPHELLDLGSSVKPTLTLAPSGFALAALGGARDILFELLDPTSKSAGTSVTAVQSDPSNGTVEDWPILFSTGGGYELVWTAISGASIVTNVPKAAQLSATGTLVNGAAIGNAKSGALSQSYAATMVGGNLFASVIATYPAPAVAQVIRVDPSLGTTTIPTSPASASRFATAAAIAPIGDEVVAVFASSPTGVNVMTATAFPIDVQNQVGTPISLKQIASNMSGSMSMASSGTAAIFAWSEYGSTTISAPSSIDLGILTNNGGWSVNSLPPLTTSGWPMSVNVLWTGANFWVLWEDQSGLFAQALDGTGQSLGKVQMLAQGTAGTGIAAVWSKGVLTLTWSVKTTIVAGQQPVPVLSVGQFGCSG